MKWYEFEILYEIDLLMAWFNNDNNTGLKINENRTC